MKKKVTWLQGGGVGALFPRSTSVVPINKLEIKSNAHSDLLQELSRWFDWNGFLEMIIQAFLDATCRRRDKHAETQRDYKITALVQYIYI